MINATFLVGRNKDEDVVKHSSSGGIMSVIAKWIFERDGVVFGAAYVDNCRKIAHIQINSFDELKNLRKSKYAWSDYTVCLKEIELLLNKGVNVLFIGTPCQCLAVKHRFDQFSNLYILDFYCHGTLEAKYYTNYIDSLGDCIKQVDFRDEIEAYDHNFVFSVTNEKGERIVEDKYEENLLTALFVNSGGLRKACFNCSICTKKHVSNITVGDVEFESMAVRHGFKKRHLSIICINDEIGKKIIHEMLDRIEYEILDERDVQEIEFYYRPHINSGRPWEYNVELRCWFENEISKYGFEEAIYRCANYYDLKILEGYDKLIKEKNIYLYGCGKKGTVIKQLIDKYYSYWNLCGYIVTSRNVSCVNELPVYEVGELNIDNEKDFVLVSVERKNQIFDILREKGLKEGVQYG